MYTFGFVLVMGIFSAFLPGLILRKIAVSCPACGGPAYNAKKKLPSSFQCAACGFVFHDELDPERLLGGILFTTVGLGITLLAIFGDSEGMHTSRVVLVLFAQVFVITGLLIMGIGGVVLRWTAKYFPRLAVLPWDIILGGGVAILVGLAFMLVSFFDTREEAFPEGRPVVFLAGLAFFLAGVAIVTPVFFGGNETTLAQTIVGATLVTAMTSVPLLLAANTKAFPLYSSIGIMGMITLFAWRSVARRILPRKKYRYPLYGVATLILYIVTRLLNHHR